MPKNKHRIQEFLRKGNSKKAICLLEKNLHKRSGDTNSWEILGFIYGEMQLYNKAEIFLTKAANLESKNLGSLRVNNALASILVDKKMYSQAIVYYQNH